MNRVRLRRCCLLAMLSLSGAGLLPSQEIPQHQLRPEWTVGLGPYSARGVFRLAVCPEGGAYLTDGLGRVAKVDAAGSVILDRDGYDSLRGILVTDCDREGPLHTLTAKEWAVWGVSDGMFRQLAATDATSLGLSPSALALSEDSSLAYVLAFRRGSEPRAEVAKLTRVSPEEIQLTGEFALGRRGTIALDRTQNRVAIMPMKPLGVMLLDGSLASDALMEPASRRIGPPDSEVISSCFPEPGHLLVQTIENMAGAGEELRMRFVLTEIETGTLRPVARNVLAGEFGGVLQGCTRGGSLYFLTVTPKTGVTIRSVRLSR